MLSSTSLDGVYDYISSLAKNSQIKDFELLFKSSFAESYSYSSGKILEQKISQSQALGIRLFRDNKSGQSYSESLEQESLETMFKQALKCLEFSNIDNNKTLIKEAEQLSDLNSELNQGHDLKLEEKLEIAKALEAEVLNKSALVKACPDNGLHLLSTKTQIVNSHGLDANLERKKVHAYSSCLIEEGANQGFDSLGIAYLNLKEVDVKFIADEIFKESSLMLTAKPIQSAYYDVIFNIETLESLFYTFSQIFSSEAARKGLNPLWSKLGDSIASPLLSIEDKPRAEYGLARISIDDEGSLTKNIKLIENGYFANAIYNSYTANFFGKTNTAHAKRSPKSSLDLALHQPFISTGKSSTKDLYSGSLAYITRLDGLHSGANLSSGDFSFGAAGHVLKDGVFQYAFKESTIKGNFYQLLKNIAAIADEEKASYSKDFFSPEIRFSGLSLAS